MARDPDAPQLSVVVDQVTRRRVRYAALKDDVSVAEWLRAAINEKLKRDQIPEDPKL